MSVMLVPPDVTVPSTHGRSTPLATVRPAGRLSTNPTPVRATVLAAGLVIVNCSCVVPLSGSGAGLKLLLITGGAITVRLAMAAGPGPPLELTRLVILV